MPHSPRLARALLAACLAVAFFVTAIPAPASALEPPRPLPGYRPVFVTEVDRPPYRDCLWASGAMLLDKLTSGQVRVTRERLRALSGDRHGGSNLADLQVAFRKLGVDLPYSPDGGARITWRQLLSRLARGAGAVILGDDSKLPRYYGRWDPGFWRNTGEDDNHAVYVDRYDAKRGRVWLMDPLARGDWQGEWISVASLRRFAWTTRAGVLSVAVTPPAKAAPYEGVELGEPLVAANDARLRITWPLEMPAGWSFPGASVATGYVPVDDPLRAAAEALADLLPPDATTTMAPSDGAVVDGSTLTASSTLPAAPGAYQATATLTDLRFGRPVVAAGPVTVFVPGPRRASVNVHAPETPVLAGDLVPVWITIINTGTETWVDPPLIAGAPAEAPGTRSTRLVASWVRLDVAEGDLEGARHPDDAILELVPLEPGRAAPVEAEVRAPATEGRWALVVDVVDDMSGSYAILGSAPAVAILDVVPLRGIEGIE